MTTDNAPLPADGRIVATDLIDGVDHQRVKVQHGEDGTATDVSTTSPLPVMQKGDSIDRNTNSLAIVHYAEKMAHEGEHFFYKTWADVEGADTVLAVMFTTPDTTTRVHAKAIIAAEAEFTIEIYEGGTVSDNGVEVTTFNNDRDSTKTPGLTAYSAPTVTDYGTLIWASKIGAGKSATVNTGLSYEIIAARNKKYIFKITKAAAGTHWIDFDFFWFEHTPLD